VKPSLMAVCSHPAPCPQALLLRASYGGMQGDQAMLRRFAKLWEDRHGASHRLLAAIMATFISRRATS
jgi:hypothetical protein